MKVILGDNQFQGINHTGGRSIEYQNTFSQKENIVEILDAFLFAGGDEFAFTNTQKLKDLVIDYLPTRDIKLHPAFPSAREINHQLSTLGFTGFLKNQIKSIGYMQSMFAFLNMIFGNYKFAMKLYIKSEISGYDRDKIASIGLLNTVVDVFLPTKRAHIITDFIHAVKQQNKKPLLYTMNPVKLVNYLSENQICDVIIVTNYNESGYRVNPNKTDVIEVIKNNSHKFEFWVMSVFSGSTGGIDGVVDLLTAKPGISGVLFGSSQSENVATNYKKLSVI